MDFVPTMLGRKVATPGPAWSAGAGVIEIEFAAGARLRITGAVDAATRDGGRGVG
jgi:transposase